MVGSVKQKAYPPAERVDRDCPSLESLMQVTGPVSDLHLASMSATLPLGRSSCCRSQRLQLGYAVVQATTIRCSQRRPPTSPPSHRTGDIEGCAVRFRF